MHAPIINNFINVMKGVTRTHNISALLEKHKKK